MWSRLQSRAEALETWQGLLSVMSAVSLSAVNDGVAEPTPADRMLKRGNKRPREGVLSADEVQTLLESHSSWDRD